MPKETKPRLTWYEVTLQIRPLEGPCDWEKALDRAQRGLTDILGPALFDNVEVRRMVDGDT